ncbi:MAG: type I pantothenate kinase [Propionibacteriaceae bacterium]|nr:type I pantothenate kinase [Propionibacteriaceae bacterium]
MIGNPEADLFGPYVTLTRQHWAKLAAHIDDRLDDETLRRLRGIDDPTDQSELEEVYHPLTQLLERYLERTGVLYSDTHEFLGIRGHRTPFVIGIAGSVAVGKSTVSRMLRELLSRLPGRPQVDLVTTDGFLYPNETLKLRGLLGRKGFPESYDRRSLLNFVMAVKSGEPEVVAPKYSHIAYDIVPDEQIVVRQPDILIVEGLNVLQPARLRMDGSPALAISDFFDFSIYVDANELDLKRWYIERFLTMRETAFRNPDSYFSRYAELSKDQAIAVARDLWDTINGPNLSLNIQPTRGRATIVLRKDERHHVAWVRIRKI